jgi:hypothetical protein
MTLIELKISSKASNLHKISVTCFNLNSEKYSFACQPCNILEETPHDLFVYAYTLFTCSCSFFPLLFCSTFTPTFPHIPIPTKMSLNANPPIFLEAEKFDGTNFATFETLIIIAASSRGVLGYLRGTILNTANPKNSAALHYTPEVLNIPLPNDPTPWYSTTPSGAEWAMCDAWACALLLYNTKNAIGLGLKLDGTAADAWTSLTSQYKVSSDLAIITTQRDLCNASFSDSNDFPTHISNLRTKWATANNAGAKITDADFRMIILSSLPTSWDSVVGTLYEAKSSVDVINRLMIHWNHVDRSKSAVNPAMVVTALQTDVKQSHNQLQCANPNCRHQGHTIINCYWRGGGKEGQFPPGFGQHGGVHNSASQNTTSTTNTSSVTAALTNVSPTSELTLALMSDLGNDYLLTKETSVASVHGNDVMELNRTGEVLLASKEGSLGCHTCVSSYDDARRTEGTNLCRLCGEQALLRQSLRLFHLPCIIPA